jgi:hypothetical protein
MSDPFKVIPMSEAIAAAPYLPPADPVFTHEEIAAGYDRIAREGWGVRIEEAQAWKAGHEGMPPDRDVWAFIYDHEHEEDVQLVRGCADGRDFVLAVKGDDDPWYETGHVICWFDGEERPSFSVAVVKAIVASLAELERTGLGHVVEDWLHREALRAVVAGHPDAQAIAAAALESRTVKFTRYYS